jgi:hypothetical protein
MIPKIVHDKMKILPKIQQAIANSTTKQVKRAKITIALLALILAVTDAIFAMNDNDGLPTYSKLFKDKQSNMLWFTFLFGVLVGKIFYNTFTTKHREETRGVLILGAVVLGLVAVGNIWPTIHVEVWIELILFTGGIFAAHFIWPQYKKPGHTG